VGKTSKGTRPLAVDKTNDQLINDCIGRWRETERFGHTAYAVSAELLEQFDHVELVLDGRVRTLQGDFKVTRFVCPLTAEGKVDYGATEIKKTLASLGARY
jgi:hypothetical protein